MTLPSVQFSAKTPPASPRAEDEHDQEHVRRNGEEADSAKANKKSATAP